MPRMRADLRTGVGTFSSLTGLRDAIAPVRTRPPQRMRVVLLISTSNLSSHRFASSIDGSSAPCFNSMLSGTPWLLRGYKRMRDGCDIPAQALIGLIRILIPISCNFFSESPSQKNSKVKRAWLGAMGDRPGSPSRVRMSEDKVRMKDMC
jgi:hypothetical protein